MCPTGDDRRRVPALLLLGLCLVQSSSAATESSSSLHCTVTKQSDGAFMYKLSEPPISTECQTSWEDRNQTVLARDFKYHPDQVQTLTNQSIVLKHCQDYLHHTRDCSGDWKDVHCRVNCSRLPDQNLHPPTVNYSICVTDTWCVDKLTFGLCIGGIVITVVVLGVIIRFIITKSYKRRGTANVPVSYDPATMTITVQKQPGII
ncbi:uncharacterized protein [Trachinotus anak]|uniref:uncharacterized protein n=1 Tax=Trachinotus anak TaxID=443729 RepID=UPI0039F18980